MTSLLIISNLNRVSLKYGILILLYSVYNIDCNGQDKKIVVYASDLESRTGDILHRIYTLTDKNNDKLFDQSEVLDLNLMKDGRSSNNTMTRTLDDYEFDHSHSLPDKLAQINSEYGARISTYKNFLLVEISKIDHILEYRFSLFPVLKDSLNKGAYFDVENSRRSSTSIAINADNAVFKHKIDNCLKELFPETHHPPLAHITVDRRRLNGKLDTEKSLIYAGRGDTVLLNAYLTRDSDTPQRFLEYDWIGVENGYSSAQKKHNVIDKGNSECQIVLLDTGMCHIVLKAKDGVWQSESLPTSFDTITIVSLEKPIVKISPKSIASYHRRAFDEDIKFTNQTHQIHILSNKPIESIYVDTAYVTFYEDTISVETTPTQDSIKTTINVSPKNITFSRTLPIKVTSTKHISNYEHLRISHKVYKPYHLSAYREYSKIVVGLINDSQITQEIVNWIEYDLGFHLQIFPKFSMGIGRSFNSQVIGNDNNTEIKISSRNDICFTYMLFSRSIFSINANLFGKTLLVEEQLSKYHQFLWGSRLKVSMSMLDGYADLSGSIGLFSGIIKPGAIKEYSPQLGLGIKIFLKEKKER